VSYDAVPAFDGNVLTETEVVSAPPGDRCPPDWLEDDGLLRVTIVPDADDRSPTMVLAYIRGWELTRVCRSMLFSELRVRRITK
jgi:hypothetical protein